MRGAGRPHRERLFAGSVVAGLAIAVRLLEAHGRLDRVSPAGSAAPMAEVNRWLPWQLWDNVLHGRSPLDASVFVGETGTLLGVVGNPGLAMLSAPLHAFGSASVGAALGVLLVMTLNIFGGAVYGGAFSVPWLGALAGAATFWVTGAANGHGAQVCFGPAAFAAAAWLADRRRLAWGLTLVAALLAPVPTVGFLLGAGVFPLGAFAALGLLVAPLGSWGASGVGPADLLWPAARAARALPLALWLAIVASWNARGWCRLATALVVIGLLLGLQPQGVSGFQVVAGLAPASGAALTGALALALGVGLPLAARLVAHHRLGIGLLLTADAVGPMLLGGGVAWETHAPVPGVFRELAQHPREAEVYVLPEDRNPAAGVGWILLHRQRSARIPVIEGLSSARAPEAEVVIPNTITPNPITPNDIAARLRGNPEPLVLVLTEVNAAEASAFASTLGPPDETTPEAVVWRWP